MVAKGKQKPKEDRTPAELIATLKGMRDEIGNYLGNEGDLAIDKLVDGLEEIENSGDEEEEEGEEE